MNSAVGGTQKTTSAIEGTAAKAGNRENLALGVTKQVGIGSPQGNTVAIVKCILTGNLNKMKIVLRENYESLFYILL